MNTYADVTDEQFTEAIKALVKESPDKVYARPEHMEAATEAACYYVHTSPEDETQLSPGCLIGAALHKVGVPLEELRKHEGQAAWALLRRLMPHLSADTVNFAGDIQAWQDQRNAWGDSLIKAI
jgi:hypothetical protein